MNEAQQWLNNRSRSYLDGVKIYNRYKISNKHDAFFSSATNPSEEEPQYKILMIQMQKIARVQGNHAPPVPEQPVKTIEVKTIISNVKDEDVDALRGNALFVNKLLAMGWDNLNDTDKKVFYDNQGYYLEKQEALFEVSRLKNEMHLADAKRKEAKSSTIRKQFNDQMNALSNQIRDIFKTKIDVWDPPAPKGSNAAKEAVERERKIRYLSGTAIPRAKKELRDNKKLTEKQRKERRDKIEAWQKELAELEKIHQM
ncbi:MAG: hypothetical protein UY18_C0036G0005 [Microgenomates group bacterium GW2011_GWF2_47_9]|nr:MAG: hypothetical protein UY18_C0036G0005 [Microgenomates group bacterium GW2011_GWF2_47_9]